MKKLSILGTLLFLFSNNSLAYKAQRKVIFYCVKAGDNLELIMQKGSMNIKAIAKALENGNVGNYIKIKLPFSKQHIKAKIIGPGSARITNE